MKSRIHTATQQKISVRKRLRLVCEFFEQLNTPLLVQRTNEEEVAQEAARVGGPIEDARAQWNIAVGVRNYLPNEAVITIRDWLAANGIDNADLMAIRQTPFKWCRGDPYKWLWILHRYTNRYAK